MSDEQTSGPIPAWSRRTALTLGGAAGLGALAGCSSGSDDSENKLTKKIKNPPDNLNKKGFPIVKDSITLHFMTGKGGGSASNYNKVASWEKYQKMTNIKIDWGLVQMDALDEKRNLALNGGDYPEAFHTARPSIADVGRYGRQGVFVKLNKLIDEYMPNLKKFMKQNPDVERGMTFPDGAIYGMPNIQDPDFDALRIEFKPYVRGDWLDKFDMEAPTTTKEYHEFLRAVKKKKPNGKDDAIGYCSWGKGKNIRKMLMGAFGIGNRGTSQPYLDADPQDDHKVRFYPITEEYKALLEYIHGLYKEGLIAKNIFSIDPAKFQAAAAKGTYGSVIEQSPYDQYGGKTKQMVPMPALKGPEGEHKYNFIGSPLTDLGNFLITDKNKHPVATARWMDYFYSDEGSKLFFMGVEGKSYKETKDGAKLLDKIKHNPDKTVDEALKPYVTYFGGHYPGIVKEEFFQGYGPQAFKAAKVLKPYEQTKIWPFFTFTQDESDKLESLSDDIEKYVDESTDKFISGDLKLADWKKYVDKIKQMGLDEYMEIQQAAYDRYRKE